MARTTFLGVLGTAAIAFFSACSSSSSSGEITLLFDSDGDGIPDALEARLGSDGLSADSPYVGGAMDENTAAGPGLDDIPDGLEQYLLGLVMGPITARTDSDADGLPDYIEVRIGADPIDFTSPYLDGASDFEGPSGPAGDGVSDGLELYLTALGAFVPVTPTNDSDGDGIEDVIELHTGTDPVSALDPRFGSAFDLDGDGIPDYLELRLGSSELNQHFPVFEGASDDDGGAGGPDGDGITDGLETFLIRQGALAPVTTFSDTDFDGIPDYAEVLAGTDPLDTHDPLLDGGTPVQAMSRVTRALERILVRSGAAAPVTEQSDSDADGIVDFAEVLSGTPPFDATRPGVLAHFDLDMDGVSDFLEILLETNPLDSDSPVVAGHDDVNDATGPPGDAISDGMEAAIRLLVGAIEITTFTDSDGDGVSDFIEVQVFSSPLDPDAPLTDGDQDVAPGTGPAGDGISDALEALLIALGSEAPITIDTNSDSDSIPDVIELRTGTDPRDGDSPRTNAVADIDGDKAPDYFELLHGADPSSPDDPVLQGALDSDGDGLSDALELLLELEGSLVPVRADNDLDGDGLYDYLELYMPSRIALATDPAASGADTNSVTGPPGDGISDALELFLIGGGAQRPVTTLTDTDGDSIPDYLEARIGVDMFDFSDPVASGPAADDDGDGVSNALELVLAALGAREPIDGFTDSDGDGAPDYLEVVAGGDAFDSEDPASGGFGDDDGDGIPNAVELLLVVLGTEAPISHRSDTDADGIPDYFELDTGTNIALSDHPSEGGALDVLDTGPVDTIPDGLEALLIQLGAAAPVGHGNDSDRDGAPDHLEIIAGVSAFEADDPLPGGGDDTDEDRMSQALEEVLLRLGAAEPVGIQSDTDLDGAPDWFELLALAHPVDAHDPVPFGATGSFDANHDTGPPNDGVSDALEALLIRVGAKPPVFTSSDTDSDGLPDYFEVRLGSLPTDPDSPLVNGGRDSDDSTGPPDDGISDVLESVLIALGAAGPVTRATDSDLDGAPDYLEVYRGTDPFDEESLPPAGTKPVAQQVGIEGSPLLGSELVGRYVYSDPDNDPEGATGFRWLRDGVPIAGSLSSSYRVQSNDLGRSVAFEVTPASDFAFPSSSAVGNPVRVELFIPQPDFPMGEGGPGGIGRPDGASDLTLWLESSSGTQTNSNRLELWLDRSGYGLEATPIADGSEPAFVPVSGPNGTPAVGFDGTQAMSFPRPVEDDFTIIAACRTDDATGNGSWWESPAIVGGETPPPLGDDFHVGINFGRALFVVADATANAGTAIDDNEPHVVTAWRVMANGRMRLYTDGRADGFNTSSSVSLVSPEVLVLGAATESGGFWKGELYELIFFHRALNLAERRIIHNYLVGRYGGALETPLYEQYETHGANIAGIGMNTETSFVTAAEGVGIVRISAPTALDPGDYLLFGTDLPKDFSLSKEVPPSVTHRLARTWSFHVTDGGGTDGVGEVDIRFRIGPDLLVSKDPMDLALLLDEDTDMTNAQVVTTGIAVEGETVTFRSVELGEFSYFGLAVRPVLPGE